MGDLREEIEWAFGAAHSEFCISSDNCSCYKYSDRAIAALDERDRLREAVDKFLAMHSDVGHGCECEILKDALAEPEGEVPDWSHPGV